MLFIDSSEGHLNSTGPQLLNTFSSFTASGSKNTIKCFIEGADALTFLKTVKTTRQEQACPDLIFMTYSVKESQGLLLLQEIIDLYLDNNTNKKE